MVKATFGHTDYSVDALSATRFWGWVPLPSAIGSGIRYCQLEGAVFRYIPEALGESKINAHSDPCLEAVLTSTSTLAKMRAEGTLRALDAPGSSLCERTLYYSLEWSHFVARQPRGMSTGLRQRRSVSLRDQLVGLARDFCRGATLAGLENFGMWPPFSRMDSPHDWVWEMRTGDTRTFGWFPVPDVFVAVAGVRTQHLKIGARANRARYAACAGLVQGFLAFHGVPEAEICREADIRNLITEGDRK